jgi:hypothetical protein
MPLQGLAGVGFGLGGADRRAQRRGGLVVGVGVLRPQAQGLVLANPRAGGSGILRLQFETIDAEMVAFRAGVLADGGEAQG